eukprot:TRINITY_DN2962_c0_g1_i2.p1 TRINITY_DN2962_c0_g1~~TRINITY_DN2962_c0_g1_i2.p1  ORF type:complete len:282 (+),score=16.41 TRINITY_DN2962_c0_g1_i2:420-1265(+)
MSDAFYNGLTTTFCRDLDSLTEWNVPLMEMVLAFPVAFFLLFLLINLKTAIRKLKSTESLIISTYYSFIWGVTILLTLHTIYRMCVPDIVGWQNIILLALMLCFVFIEVSVFVFMSHRHTVSGREAIKQTVLISGTISISSFSIQTLLVFLYNTKIWPPEGAVQSLVSLYWTSYHGVFVIVYFIILMLPFTKFKDNSPPKSTYYKYITYLFVIHLVQHVGSLYIYAHLYIGYCFMEIGNLLYYGMFGPVLYYCFLHEWFKDISLPHYYQEMSQQGYMDTDK